MTHSYFKRPQNESARYAEGLKEGVKQVKCAIGTANFLDEAFALIERTRLAEAYFGDEKDHKERSNARRRPIRSNPISTI
eukprot:scaffold6550_cov74-Cyclotella_meneghiniana.AAC.11